MEGFVDPDDFKSSVVEDDSEVETKLELAAAYLEVGDRDGAREMLAEVAREPAARPAPKDRARQMVTSA